MPETPSPDPENVRVGATIRELRLSRELTSDELGRAIGVTGGQIRHIERGIRKAQLADCRAIARVLGVPLAAITVEDYARIADPQPVEAGA